MEMTTTDHLAAVVDAWDAWDDDSALRWETRCKEAVAAARAHLRPVLVDADPSPAPRCLP